MMNHAETKMEEPCTTNNGDSADLHIKKNIYCKTKEGSGCINVKEEPCDANSQTNEICTYARKRTCEFFKRMKPDSAKTKEKHWVKPVKVEIFDPPTPVESCNLRVKEKPNNLSGNKEFEDTRFNKLGVTSIKEEPSDYRDEPCDLSIEEETENTMLKESSESSIQKESCYSAFQEKSDNSSLKNLIESLIQNSSEPPINEEYDLSFQEGCGVTHLKICSVSRTKESCNLASQVKSESDSPIDKISAFTNKKTCNHNLKKEPFVYIEKDKSKVSYINKHSWPPIKNDMNKENCYNYLKRNNFFIKEKQEPCGLQVEEDLSDESMKIKQSYCRIQKNTRSANSATESYQKNVSIKKDEVFDSSMRKKSHEISSLWVHSDSNINESYKKIYEKEKQLQSLTEYEPCTIDTTTKTIKKEIDPITEIKKEPCDFQIDEHSWISLSSNDEKEPKVNLSTVEKFNDSIIKDEPSDQSVISEPCDHFKTNTPYHGSKPEFPRLPDRTVVKKKKATTPLTSIKLEPCDSYIKDEPGSPSDTGIDKKQSELSLKNNKCIPLIKKEPDISNLPKQNRKKLFPHRTIDIINIKCDSSILEDPWLPVPDEADANEKKYISVKNESSRTNRRYSPNSSFKSEQNDEPWLPCDGFLNKSSCTSSKENGRNDSSIKEEPEEIEVKVDPLPYLKEVRPFNKKKLTQKYIQQEYYQYPQLNEVGQTFKCSECNKSFTMKNLLTHHVIFDHKNLKLLKCPICHRRFTKFNGLSNHIRAAHKIARHHICQMCHHAFSRHHYLANHMKSVHKLL